MEYMESKMQDRLEASISEYVQMEEEIQTLRAKVESEKLVSNMQAVLIDDFKIRNSELVEALREITNIANAPSFHYRNMAQKALATYDKLSEVKHDTNK